MPTELFTSKATYPNNIMIPPVALRHPAYYNKTATVKDMAHMFITNVYHHKRALETIVLDRGL